MRQQVSNACGRSSQQLALSCILSKLPASDGDGDAGAGFRKNRLRRIMDLDVIV
jgi:hypothetical protein